MCKGSFYSLFQLTVDGENFWMTHKSEGQDRYSVRSLTEKKNVRIIHMICIDL